MKEAAKDSLKDVLAQKEALAVSSPPPAKRKRNESSSFENGDESKHIYFYFITRINFMLQS